jgi:homopolymeric O-antigen transport system permease protein
MLILIYDPRCGETTCVESLVLNALTASGHHQEALRQRYCPTLKTCVSADENAAIVALTAELGASHLALRYSGPLTRELKALIDTGSILALAEFRHPGDLAILKAASETETHQLRTLPKATIDDGIMWVIGEYRRNFSSWFNGKGVALFQYGTLRTFPHVLIDYLSERLGLRLAVPTQSARAESCTLCDGWTERNESNLFLTYMDRSQLDRLNAALAGCIEICRGTWSVSDARQAARTSERKNEIATGWRDIVAAVIDPSVAMALAHSRHKTRYSRVGFGLLYVTLSTAVWILGLGMIGSAMFHRSLSEYLPYVAFGIISWQILANAIVSAAQTYITSSGLALNTNVPKASFAMSHMLTASAATLYRLPAIILVLFFSEHVNIATVAASLFGLVAMLIFGFGLSLALGPLCARFRDLRELIEVSLQLLFFASATFWHPETLGKWAFLIEFNPLFHFLQVVRAPAIGVDFVSLGVVTGMAMATTAAGIAIFNLTYRRLVFWISS